MYFSPLRIVFNYRIKRKYLNSIKDSNRILHYREFFKNYIHKWYMTNILFLNIISCTIKLSLNIDKAINQSMSEESTPN